MASEIAPEQRQAVKELQQAWGRKEMVFDGKRKELAFEKMLTYLDGEVDSFDVEMAGAFWQERNYGKDGQEDDWVLVQGRSFTKKELGARVNRHIQRLTEDGSVHFIAEEREAMPGISNLFQFYYSQEMYKDPKININLEPLRQKVADSRTDDIRGYLDFKDPMSAIEEQLKRIWDEFDGKTTELVYNGLVVAGKEKFKISSYQELVEKWKGVVSNKVSELQG